MSYSDKIKSKTKWNEEKDVLDDSFFNELEPDLTPLSIKEKMRSHW